MKLLVLANENRVARFLPDLPVAKNAEVVILPIDTPEDEVIRKGQGADAFLVDAISPCTRREMEEIGTLKLIQSEGVAYNRIDVKAAAEFKIPVCNQKGANAVAVAEETVMLMLCLLRSVVPGYRAVLSGHQIEQKDRLMAQGIRERSEVRVGLVGFGAIGKETARLLVPFGPEVVYWQRHRADSAVEEDLHASYTDLDTLLATSDIVSLHVPVTPDTTLMCDASFFEKMKDGVLFINTARGELVDNMALRSAILSGKVALAGIDTLAPEPVQKDNPLLTLPEDVQDRVLVTPHEGGITTGFFKRAHRTLWENIELVLAGKEPRNKVN